MRTTFFAITTCLISWPALTGSPAAAASFDCGHASTAMEKAICASRPVSTADDAMAAAYATAMAGLSTEGQDALRSSQRNFLRYLQVLCGPGAAPLDSRRWLYSGGTPVAACLENTINDRTGQLKHAVIRLGGHTFLTTTQYDAWSYDGNRGYGEGDVERVYTLVQIDAPATSAEKEWNSAAQKWLADGVTSTLSREDGSPADGKDFNAWVEMRIDAASADLIVTELGVSTYTQGMPHPFYNDHGWNWSLKLGRALTTTDIFNPSTPWSKDLIPLAQQKLVGLNTPSETGFSQIRTIDKIYDWRIHPDGLQINFGQYELGGYMSAAVATLPWGELTPYLQTSLPFTPGQLEMPPAHH